MILRTLTFSMALLALATRASAAQTSPFRPAASPLFRAAVATPPSDALNLPKTYAKTGALIVGIPSAIFGAAVGVGLCGLNDSAQKKSCFFPAVGFAAMFGGLGAITGALIGGQIERR